MVSVEYGLRYSNHMINYPSNLHVMAFSGFHKNTGMIDEARETGETKKRKVCSWTSHCY